MTCVLTPATCAGSGRGLVYSLLHLFLGLAGAREQLQYNAEAPINFDVDEACD